MVHPVGFRKEPGPWILMSSVAFQILDSPLFVSHKTLEGAIALISVQVLIPTSPEGKGQNEGVKVTCRGVNVEGPR